MVNEVSRDLCCGRKLESGGKLVRFLSVLVYGLSKKITERISSIDRWASQTTLAVKPEQNVKTSENVFTGIGCILRRLSVQVVG